MTPIEAGICQCGCGRPTRQWTEDDASQGRRRGEYARFVHGHNGRKSLSACIRRVERNGYVTINRQYEHRIVAARALGRELPAGAEVHHVDGNKTNNSPSNLVICQDRAYHDLLETRQRALAACGNPSWRACRHCGEHDDPSRLRNAARTSAEALVHDACAKAAQRRRRELEMAKRRGRGLPLLRPIDEHRRRAGVPD